MEDDDRNVQTGLLDAIQSLESNDNLKSVLPTLRLPCPPPGSRPALALVLLPRQTSHTVTLATALHRTATHTALYAACS